MIFFFNFPVDTLVVLEHVIALLNFKFASFEFLKLGSNYSHLRVSKFSHHNHKSVQRLGAFLCMELIQG